MVTEHIFNPTLPKLGSTLDAPSEAELGNVRCFKYADCEYVWDNCENDYVREVLRYIPIVGKHKRVLIDVKIHDLEPGEVPCVPGWHLDGSINPKDLPKQPETFTLFVTGEHARTEFPAEPVHLEVDDGWNFATMSQRCSLMVPKDCEVWTIPSCQFGTYNDHYFHRGARATGQERRLLIRTTETDIIEPRNRIYTPHKQRVV